MNTLRFDRLMQRAERRCRFRPLPLPWRAVTWLAVALVLAPAFAQAADVAGAPQVVAGAATFRQNGNVRTIEQHTGAAVINWQDFGIKAGDITRFVQPGVNSAVLNRVLGANPSLIQGQLQANGSVYLINPNGIVVGPQGRIDVGAFFASTLNVSNEEFLKGGSLLFKGDSKIGIQNLGTINAKEGDVMLIAYTVKNAGEINAPKGVAGLAAGSEVLLTHQGDQRILVKSGVKADGLETGVENSGVMAAAQAELKAAGGSIYELAVNQAGVVRATGVEERNGRVLLTADGGTVKVSGEVSAKNANGSGGEILVGGDYQGKNSAVPNAARTVVTGSAKLDASASAATGNGGKVVVWADGATQFKGGIVARGGSTGGDGGQVEVSGKRVLDFAGTVDNSAPRGRRGSLLLDPDAIVIGTAADQDVFQQGGFMQALAVPSFVNNATLSALLATTDVEIRTGDPVGGPAGYNGISVNADVSWATASKLTLVSGDTIAINANLSGGAGSGLDLQAGTRSVADGSVGTISLAANNSITVGSLTLGKSSLAAPGGTDVGTVNLAGTVNASTVTLSRNSGGFAGDVLIHSANNTIGTLTGDGAAGAIGGSLKVRDSAGGLTVSGDLSGVAGAVEIVTSGSLTLVAGAQVKNTGASDLVLASRGGSFINNAGASAVDASGSGRYLIYSDTPANTTKGGLTGANLYGRTFDANAPASITHTGDRFVFSSTPTLTFTADDKTRAVGVANPALTYTVSGLVGGDTLGSAIAGTPALSTTADASTAAGTVPITIANGSLALTDLGYSLALQNAVLTITAVPLNPLTITADSFSRIYGTANPTFTASYSGFIGGDTAAVVGGLQFSTAATIASGVGAYAITPFGAAAPGYGITYVPGLLNITPADLIIRADSLSKTYGAANPTFTASFSGLVNGDLSSVVSGLSLGTTATTGSGVGAYPITGSGASAANYSISYTPGTLTINKAPLTITADNQSKTYGSANPVLTASYSGLVNGDLSSVVSGLSLGTTAATSSGVGNYPITGSGASAANYDITLAPGALTVNPATLTVRADNQSRTYGDANPTLSGTVSGFVLGEDASVLTATPTYSTAAGLTTGVGAYPITGGGAAAANYTFSYQNGALTINPAILSVRADNQVRVYGDANPALTTTVSGLKNGDSADGKFFIFTLGSVAAPNSSVGNYTILLSGNDTPNDNYSIFFANGTLTVQPRPLTIRTDNISREYGLANPAFTATFTGLAPHDTAAVIPNLGFTTLATPSSGVQTIGVTPTSGNNANYAITRVPGQMTITPAPLTIAAGSHFREYGDANPVFTPAIAAGELRAGDTIASVNLRIETTAAQTSPVGTYDLTAALSSLNYTINNPLAGSLQILPAILDVTIGNVNRFYGEANPVNVPVSATGLKLGESVGSVVSVVNPAAANQAVGTYAQVASSLSGNYQIRSVTGGGVQVNPRPVTVTADNQTRVYGDVNPTFTTTLGGMGLASFDPASVLVGNVDTTMPALRDAAIGLYVIQPSLVANPNYQVTSLQPGVLTVNPRPVTVTADNQTRVYGDVNPTFTTTLGGMGLASFDPASVLVGNVDTTMPALRDAAIGLYVIQPSLVANPNYQVTSLQPGVLTVNPRPLDISLPDLARFYYDPNPGVTATLGGAGLAPFHTAADLFSLTGILPDQSADVGSYAYFPKFKEAAKNYALTLRSGSLTIAPRAVEILVNSLTVADGAAVPAFTAQFTGLPTGVTPETAFPNLTLATEKIISIPQVRPVPNLADYLPPAPVVADSSKVGSDGDVRVVSPITPITIAPPAEPGTSGAFLLTGNITLNDKTKSTQSITANGYNDNPNYAVTKVTKGTLTLTTTTPVTDNRAAAIAAANTKLVVSTVADGLKLPEPFRGEKVQPYLQQAANELMNRLISAGDKDTLDKYFKNGAAGFLAGLQDDPAKQAMLMGALSELVLTYAKLPPDLQPPELAGIINAAKENAKQVKLDQAKEVVRLYEEWQKPPTSAEVVNVGDLNLVPDFAKQVRKSAGVDAAIVIGASLGTGATVGALMSAVPIGAITAGAAAAAAGTGFSTSTSLGVFVASEGLGAGIGIGLVAPVTMAVLAAAVVTVAAIQLAKQPEIKAGIAAAQELAATNDRSKATLDLNDAKDQDAFMNGFIKLMLNNGGF